jgi:hypothetical protein
MMVLKGMICKGIGAANRAIAEQIPHLSTFIDLSKFYVGTINVLLDDPLFVTQFDVSTPPIKWHATQDCDRFSFLKVRFEIEIPTFGNPMDAVIYHAAGSPHRSNPRWAMGKFTQTMRFLLDEKNSYYRQFVERIFRNIDVAVKNLMDASSFDDVLARANVTLEIIGDDVDFNKIVEDSRASVSGGKTNDNVSLRSRLIGGQWGSMFGGYALFESGRVMMNKRAKQSFDACQEQLRIQLASGA